jgi:hypothetical protein
MSRALRLAVVTVLAFVAGAVPVAWAAPAPAVGRVTVDGTRFVDRHGREVVLRGFNVSGEVKLAENGGLPFASTADARRSAADMRRLTGANTVRFLLSWASAQPAPGRLDSGYLGRATDQMRAFLDEGFLVLVDYHQDLYSQALFHRDSWYTGNGAPAWVVAAGGYPRESCGVCFHWGQNITQNGAVQSATYDFWHNRLGFQDAFLGQARGTLAYLREHLTGDQFDRILGVDPYNEPYAGRYDAGQDGASWERDVLWPFYQRFRAQMDAAGWQDKPAFVEPMMYWNANLDFVRQPGGLGNLGPIGHRYVFNTHFYDQKALSGFFMWGKAGDGQYSGDFTTVGQRAADLGTAAIVSEFGGPQTGFTSDKTPSVLKALYQALDSRLPGRDWWGSAAGSGPVLSGTEWQWDIYSGRHHELMNGNPDKVRVDGDAWNGEDFSVVAVDDTGTTRLRADQRVLDRLYPLAVAGRTLAFTYEDRARDGNTVLTWNPVPASLPNVAKLVGTGQYGVLVWRGGGPLPTELHLPATFPAATTTVVSDLGTVTGLRTSGPVAADGARLLLTGVDGLHWALVVNGPTAPSPELRAGAAAELGAWARTTFTS